MGKGIQHRYSKLLIPLPPVDSIKYQVEGIFDQLYQEADPPLFIQTDAFEGYGIPWIDWYGRPESVLGYKQSEELRRKMKHFQNYIDSEIIDYLDENDWNFVDDYREVFQRNSTGGWRFWEEDRFHKVILTPRFDLLEFFEGNNNRVYSFNISREQLTPDFVDYGMRRVLGPYYKSIRKLFRRGIFQSWKYGDEVYQAVKP